MWTAGRLRPGRSATSAWRAAKFSGTPLPWWPMSWRGHFAATGYGPRTSIGSCRTRPISGSSTARRDRLGIAPEKIVTTVERHANTSAASIPLALSVAVNDGRIKAGDLVLLEAMGGGFTWGAILVRW